MLGGFRLPIGVARQVRELLADPAAIPAASAATVDTVRGVLTQLSDVEQARSPLWTERSLRRRLEVVRAPFRETKDAAKRLGGTLNTAFLTAAAEAAVALPRASSGHRSSSCGRRWRSAPARPTPAPTPSPSPG